MAESITTPFANPQSKDIYRYSKELNTSFIDIEIDFYREIYNEWDFSPFTNRDIDQDLMEFLESCAGEINRRHKICIVFHIPEALRDAEKEEKSVNGFGNYFSYELRKQENKRKTIAWQAAYSGFFGLIFLFLGTSATKFLESHESYEQLAFLAEGFFIGGWVLIWELFATAFFKSKELFGRERTLKRLRDAKIVFNYR